MMRFVSGLGTGKRCFKMVAVLWPIYSIIKCKYILVKKIEENESDIKVNDIYLVHEIITIPVMPNKTKASKISLNQSLFQLQKINCHWIPTTVTVTKHLSQYLGRKVVDNQMWVSLGNSSHFLLVFIVMSRDLNMYIL